MFAQLQAKEQEAFLPLYTARHRWADRWKNVSTPLFPGYVFSRLDSQSRGCVLATAGVIDVVRVGTEPAVIDAGEIEAIRIACMGSSSLEPYEGLVKGQRVMITEGPFNGLMGTLIEIRKSFKLALSVELLNRSVLVEIDSGWNDQIDPGATIPGQDPKLRPIPRFHAGTESQNVYAQHPAF